MDHRTRLVPSVLFLLLATACGADDKEPEDAAPGVVFDAAAALDASVRDYTLIAADRNGDLFRVNPSTAAATLLLDTFTVDDVPANVDVGVLSGMQWVDSRAELWAATGGNAAFNATIQIVNTTSGELTTMVDLSDTGTTGIPGLSFRPSNGLVYTITGDSSGVRTIEPGTGNFENIGGPVGGRGNAIAFASDETMYVVDGDILQVGNPADGSIVTMTDFSYVGFPAFEENANQPIVSMAFEPNDGVLYGLLQDGAGRNSRAECFLVTIDVASATVTNVGVAGQELDGLVFVPVSVFP